MSTTRKNIHFSTAIDLIKNGTLKKLPDFVFTFPFPKMDQSFLNIKNNPFHNGTLKVTPFSMKFVTPVTQPQPEKIESTSNHDADPHNPFAPRYRLPVTPFESKSIQPIIKTVVTSGLIAAFLYPLEVLQTYSHTNITYSFKTMPLIPLAVGFGHALKSSAVKNTVLSNRDAVHARIEDVVGEKEVVVDEKEKRLDSKNLKKSALGTTIMTSAIIGFLDTAATQYFTNMKHLSSMEAAGLKSPWLNGSTSPLGILNKLHFAKMGVTARYLKNSVNALCCIGAVTILQTPMEELFPAEKYGITSNAFTTILAGTMGGFITNGLEVVYKNQIKHADFVKMQTPNMYVATKNLINEHGVKSLFKGYKYSIACSIIAFGIINGIESLFESIEEKSQKTSSNPSSFFKPANPQTKNETPVNHIPYKP